MTTQHQAPEVTSELRECPFDGAPALTAFVQAGISWWQVECSKCTAHVDAPTEAAAITAWNTRATQPLSLTVDAVRIAEREACAMVAEEWIMLTHDSRDLTGFECENRKLRLVAAAIRARS